MEVIVIMALLIFLCGFIMGVLVGVICVMATRWRMPNTQRPNTQGHAAFEEAQHTEIAEASLSDPGSPSGRLGSMETNQQDSPTVEEMPSHTDISTVPVPQGLLPHFKEADEKLVREKGLFVAGSVAFKTHDCKGNGQSTWYCSSEVSPGQSYCRPCLVCGPLMNSPMVWVCSFPCNVYHTRRSCGRLKCARHVISVSICQCKSCCDFWQDNLDK